jgi:hypothetical protein
MTQNGSSKPSIQLSEEQRQQLKALVIAEVRDALNRREELYEQAVVQRRIWQELVACPQWSIVEGEKPKDVSIPTDELWPVTPVVKKQ